MDWLRLYTHGLDSPKLQRLSGEEFKQIINLWCLARIHDGTLPSVSDVAFRLRCTETQAAEMIDDLIDKRLLDRTPNGVVPHDWTEHQYASDSSTERVQKHRERKRKQDETVLKRFGNVREQSRTEQIQSRTDTDCVPAVLPTLRKPTVMDLDGQTSQRFDEFWDRYPRQQHRDAACHQWLSVVTIGVEPALFGCLQRYLDSDEVFRGAVANPEKWLLEQHRDRWQGNWPRHTNGSTKKTAIQSALEKAREEDKRNGVTYEGD